MRRSSINSNPSRPRSVTARLAVIWAVLVEKVRLATTRPSQRDGRSNDGPIAEMVQYLAELRNGQAARSSARQPQGPPKQARHRVRRSDRRHRSSESRCAEKLARSGGTGARQSFGMKASAAAYRLLSRFQARVSRTLANSSRVRNVGEEQGRSLLVRSRCLESGPIP